MPSDSNDYIRLTSSQFAEDKEASLQDTNVDEIDAAVDSLKYNHIVSNMWGGSQMAANHRRRDMWSASTTSRVSITIGRASQPKITWKSVLTSTQPWMVWSKQTGLTSTFPTRRGGGRNRWKHCQWACDLILPITRVIWHTNTYRLIRLE